MVVLAHGERAHHGRGGIERGRAVDGEGTRDGGAASGGGVAGNAHFAVHGERVVDGRPLDEGREGAAPHLKVRTRIHRAHLRTAARSHAAVEGTGRHARHVAGHGHAAAHGGVPADVEAARGGRGARHVQGPPDVGGAGDRKGVGGHAPREAPGRAIGCEVPPFPNRAEGDGAVKAGAAAEGGVRGDAQAAAHRRGRRQGDGPCGHRHFAVRGHRDRALNVQAAKDMHVPGHVHGRRDVEGVIGEGQGVPRRRALHEERAADGDCAVDGRVARDREASADGERAASGQSTPCGQCATHRRVALDVQLAGRRVPVQAGARVGAVEGGRVAVAAALGPRGEAAAGERRGPDHGGVACHGHLRRNVHLRARNVQLAVHLHLAVDGEDVIGEGDEVAGGRAAERGGPPRRNRQVTVHSNGRRGGYAGGGHLYSRRAGGELDDARGLGARAGAHLHAAAHGAGKGGRVCALDEHRAAHRAHLRGRGLARHFESEHGGCGGGLGEGHAHARGARAQLQAARRRGDAQGRARCGGERCAGREGHAPGRVHRHGTRARLQQATLNDLSHGDDARGAHGELAARRLERHAAEGNSRVRGGEEGRGSGGGEDAHATGGARPRGHAATKHDAAAVRVR
mmetsp:Transcript_4205/g.12173  ORF Transcript_4205/g.12173 Transcript_4205/m.12173 type:complete len:627 (-) Transcript_4205:123-2003(-)